MNKTADFQSRQRGTLLGMFIGDALAMPVHWYYDRHALYRDYGHVTDYLAPKNPHPDSILWRSVYELTGSVDILHGQRKYWGQHGIHYHQFLKAGENTLNYPSNFSRTVPIQTPYQIGSNSVNLRRPEQEIQPGEYPNVGSRAPDWRHGQDKKVEAQLQESAQA